MLMTTQRMTFTNNSATPFSEPDIKVKEAVAEVETWRVTSRLLREDGLRWWSLTKFYGKANSVNCTVTFFSFPKEGATGTNLLEFAFFSQACFPERQCRCWFLELFFCSCKSVSFISSSVFMFHVPMVRWWVVFLWPHCGVAPWMLFSSKTDVWHPMSGAPVLSTSAGPFRLWESTVDSNMLSVDS